MKNKLSVAWKAIAIQAGIKTSKGEILQTLPSTSFQGTKRIVPLKILKRLLITVLAMSGVLPGRMSRKTTILVSLSLVFTLFILPFIHSVFFAWMYFLGSTAFYVGFIYTMLGKPSRRVALIERLGENGAFSSFEQTLALAFIHNAASLTLISRVTQGFMSSLLEFPITIAGVTFILIGMTVKIWAAYALGIDLYYWKDMFVGRRIKPFVYVGPYAFLSNPMYGIGQLQVYGIALLEGSFIGLICAALNQGLMFTFYWQVERPFVDKTYKVSSN